MSDTVSPEERSRIMARIRSKDTKPEMFVRRALHAAGYRYSLHSKKLPGRPDLVLTRYRAVIFVHGCFWHGHQNCRHFRLPGTRTEFWNEKISRNRERDAEAVRNLLEDGWRVGIVWECTHRDRTWTAAQLAGTVKDWLAGSEPILELNGNQTPDNVHPGSSR